MGLSSGRVKPVIFSWRSALLYIYTYTVYTTYIVYHYHVYMHIMCDVGKILRKPAQRLGLGPASFVAGVSRALV